MSEKKNAYLPFQLKFGVHNLVGDILSDNGSIHVLILHGAGESGRSRFNFFREHLHLNGISSCAFDLVGHGETGGNLNRSSLFERTQQACKIIDSKKIQQPLKIVGASMGAYTAVKLLKYYDVSTLVLLVPAMYDSAAYTVPFDKGFTQIIRYPGSWERSDAWSLLSDYRGDIFIIAAENDEVIPAGVIDKLYASTLNAQKKKLYIAPKVSHFIFTELRSENPLEYKRIMDMVVEMLS